MTKTTTPDRRVRRTRNLLENALISLLETKSIKDISVKELCETADINRGTFYLHYKDIFDMMEQLELKLMVEFEDLLSTHTPEEMANDPYPLIYDIFQFTAKHTLLCKTLLSRNGDISFLLKIKTLFRRKLFDIWISIYHKEDSAQFEYSYCFIVAGCVGLIESWLFSEHQESPEEMARLANIIITTGMNSLTKETDASPCTEQ